MSHADITFKSGAQISVNLKSVTVSKNGLGGLHSMKWEHGNDQLMHLDLEEVVAVVWHLGASDAVDS